MTQMNFAAPQRSIDDEPPRTPLGVVRIAVAAAVSGLPIGFDTAIITGAVDAITNNFTLSAAMLGVVLALTLERAAVGRTAWGSLTQRVLIDRVGRRRLLLVGSAGWPSALVLQHGAFRTQWSTPGAIWCFRRYVA